MESHLGIALSLSLSLSPCQMADVIVGEIVHGVGDSGVRCGIIGEVGCTWPLADSERRSLQAAALAQQETGGPPIPHQLGSRIHHSNVGRGRGRFRSLSGNTVSGFYS